MSERFQMKLDKFSDIHEIIIKDTDAKNQISFIGTNEVINDNLENMKKIVFLLNMMWNENMNLKEVFE